MKLSTCSDSTDDVDSKPVSARKRKQLRDSLDGIRNHRIKTEKPEEPLYLPTSPFNPNSPNGVANIISKDDLGGLFSTEVLQIPNKIK